MLSYIEISKANLRHNFALMKSLVDPKVKMVAVIKANAYGHGQNEVASVLEERADFFQVDDLEELRLLRKISSKPTLVLGYVSKAEMREALELNGILGVYDKTQIVELDKVAEKMAQKAMVHVKIDAYLGRQGILPGDVEEMAELLKGTKNIVVDGLYSHFANIEDTSDFSHAQKQIDTFTKAIEIFKKHGFEELKTHMSASSGVMAWEKEVPARNATHNVAGRGQSDLIRPGISVYGMWPSDDLKDKIESKDFALKPVMRWVTRVAQVKTVSAGYPIGYGLTYVTKKNTKIAVIPQGYSDGYDRGLSNKGMVLIGGKRCQVIGRVAMNMFVVDVSHLEQVQAEDEVVLLGQQGEEEIRAEEIAEWIGTINYEITTRVSPLLPRKIV